MSSDSDNNSDLSYETSSLMYHTPISSQMEICDLSIQTIDDDKTDVPRNNANASDDNVNDSNVLSPISALLPYKKKTTAGDNAGSSVLSNANDLILIDSPSSDCVPDHNTPQYSKEVGAILKDLDVTKLSTDEIKAINEKLKKANWMTDVLEFEIQSCFPKQIDIHKDTGERSQE